MFSAEEHLRSRLQERNDKGLLRSLSTNSGLIDFCSNDYLGFARSVELRKLIDKNSSNGVGATGSRLLTGNSPQVEELERKIAAYHRGEAALLFNSGYDANIGLLSSVPQEGDTVLYDELIHASVRDGIRLSYAKAYKFRHNDVEHLKELLHKAGGNCYVAVESVYSMDGDFSPLAKISEVCAGKANVIVDEAHATGLFGPSGEGRVVESGLEDQVFTRVHTFGKALGCHGAVVVGSAILREYLVNFARSFVYTTALGFDTLCAVDGAYDLLINANDKVKLISKLSKLFKLKMKELGIIDLASDGSPIQALIIGNGKKAKELAKQVQNGGYDVRPILSPTVPKGSERLRICFHAFNTIEEVNGLAHSIKSNL